MTAYEVKLIIIVAGLAVTSVLYSFYYFKIIIPVRNEQKQDQAEKERIFPEDNSSNDEINWDT